MLSLFSRLSIVFTFILLSLGTLVWFIAHYSQQRYFEESTQQLNRPVAMYIAQQVPLFINGNYDKRALESLAEHVMIINPSLALYLLDEQGQVMASAASGDHSPLVGVSIDLQPVHQFLAASQTSPVYGDDPLNPGQKRIFSAYPLADSGIGSSGCSPCGYVYAVLGEEHIVSPLKALMSSETRQFSTLMLLAVVLCALLAGVCIFFLLTRPLRAMTAYMAQWQLMASGLHHGADGSASRALVTRGGELEALDDTCRDMAERLSSQYIELEHADKRRRQFLTSLSHDLRTPLTSVNGALEMLVSKQHDLDADERHRYLTVARRQTDRLHRLIDQLFELARLDSGDVSLALEPVSIQELVMDTVQDFATQALRKGIRLTFEPAEPEREYLVDADVGQLNRVLVNLLSNAIRHTPRDGSICLQTQRDTHKRMAVSITDSGNGFPCTLEDHSLSSTDPVMFAKDENSGTGLGLGIVSRIVSLHGSEVRVCSTPGQGTRITFWLKANGTNLSPSFPRRRGSTA